MGYTEAPPGWWQEFVRATPPRTAVLAVTRLDGSPHAAPIWVDLDEDGDGEIVVFTTGLDTLKGKAIARDGRVCLVWDDERPPFAFVTITGHGTISDDPDDVRRWATRIGGRYMGPHRAAEFGARNGVPPEVVVRVRPERVVAKVDVAD
ncbi:MAG: TIGR03618 family F420-dependent PPOX class oxidoreductase [Kineosporiaceae bacterium]